MIRNPFFKRVQEIANSAKVKAFQQGSIEWYRKKIGSLTNKPSSQELIQKGNQKTMIIPGNLYFYFYDPKLKDDVKKLPYYDKFPFDLYFFAQNFSGNGKKSIFSNCFADIVCVSSTYKEKGEFRENDMRIFGNFIRCTYCNEYIQSITGDY